MNTMPVIEPETLELPKIELPHQLQVPIINPPPSSSTSSSSTANDGNFLEQSNSEFWDQIMMQSVKFEMPVVEEKAEISPQVPTMLLPSVNRTLEENANYLNAKLKKETTYTTVLTEIFKQAAKTQSRTSGRKRQNFKMQNRKAQNGTVRLKTWQEFNALHEHAIKHGFKITEEEITKKYKNYVTQGQAIADVEKQYLTWLQEIEAYSLHLDESKKNERLQARKQRIQDLFTKLRWHLSDRFIPEVLTQTVKRVSRGRRALPKEAVQILKKWLFEHFGNPYPNTIEKQHLAYRTGLTTQQVSYWFINARVRIWKPMVEKYTENGNALPNTLIPQTTPMPQ